MQLHMPLSNQDSFHLLGAIKQVQGSHIHGYTMLTLLALRQFAYLGAKLINISYLTKV